MLFRAVFAIFRDDVWPFMAKFDIFGYRLFFAKFGGFRRIWPDLTEIHAAGVNFVTEPDLEVILEREGATGAVTRKWDGNGDERTGDNNRGGQSIFDGTCEVITADSEQSWRQRFQGRRAGGASQFSRCGRTKGYRGTTAGKG